MYECLKRRFGAFGDVLGRAHRPRREFTLVLLSLSSMKERGEKL